MTDTVFATISGTGYLSMPYQAQSMRPKLDRSAIVYDEHGGIDWKANGWPEPNMFYAGNTNSMPFEVLEDWFDACDRLERMDREDLRWNPRTY